MIHFDDVQLTSPVLSFKSHLPVYAHDLRTSHAEDGGFLLHLLRVR